MTEGKYSLWIQMEDGSTDTIECDSYDDAAEQSDSPDVKRWKIFHPDGRTTIVDPDCAELVVTKGADASRANGTLARRPIGLPKADRDRIIAAYDAKNVTHHAGQQSRSRALQKLYHAAIAIRKGAAGVNDSDLPGQRTVLGVLREIGFAEPETA